MEFVKADNVVVEGPVIQPDIRRDFAELLRNRNAIIIGKSFAGFKVEVGVK